jgi:hypothetical protein
LVPRRHVLHQHEENNQVHDEESVGDRNELPPRHARDDHREQRVGGDHRHQNHGEHPPQIFVTGGADVVANRSDHVVPGQHDKKEKETKPQRTDLVRPNINDFGKNAFHRNDEARMTNAKE